MVLAGYDIEPVDAEEWVRESMMVKREKSDSGRHYFSGVVEADECGYSNNMDLSEGEEEYDLSKFELEPLLVFRSCPMLYDEEEEQISEVSGTRMNAQLISHDAEKIDIGIEDETSVKNNSEKKMLPDVENMEQDKSATSKASDEDASGEVMSTEMVKQKEKRKSLENGVDPLK